MVKSKQQKLIAQTENYSRTKQTGNLLQHGHIFLESHGKLPHICLLLCPGNCADEVDVDSNHRWRRIRLFCNGTE